MCPKNLRILISNYIIDSFYHSMSGKFVRFLSDQLKLLISCLLPDRPLLSIRISIAPTYGSYRTKLSGSKCLWWCCPYHLMFAKNAKLWIPRYHSSDLISSKQKYTFIIINLLKPYLNGVNLRERNLSKKFCQA